MKIYISADIEGVNGIAASSEVDKKSPEFGYFAVRMTEEVAAVCQGISESAPGADIFVKDAHGTGRNLDHSKFPKNVRLNRGWHGGPGSMVGLLDESFDAAIFTGYHSAAYHGGNPLAHTMNSERIFHVTINGMTAGEFHINYYAALSLGVPVVMVSGDKALMDVVNDFDKEIITVPTVEGIGNSTTSIHPALTVENLRQSAQEAAAKALTTNPKAAAKSKLPENFDVRISFKRQHMAYRAAFFPGMTKVDDMTVAYKCKDFYDFLRAWMFVV